MSIISEALFKKLWSKKKLWGKFLLKVLLHRMMHFCDLNMEMIHIQYFNKSESLVLQQSWISIRIFRAPEDLKILLKNMVRYCTVHSFFYESDIFLFLLQELGENIRILWSSWDYWHSHSYTNLWEHFHLRCHICENLANLNCIFS